MENKINIHKKRQELISLKEIIIDTEMLKIMTRDIMYKYCAVPIQVSENNVLIAMGNPYDKKAMENISSLLKRKIDVIPADSKEIYVLINSINESQETNLVIEQITRNLEKNILTGNGDININNNNQNPNNNANSNKASVEVEISVLLDEARAKVETDESLSELEIKEILEKMEEIKAVHETDETKNKKLFKL